MIRVHGNAFLQFGEDTPIKASWSGIYLAKKNGYKMKLSGDNIEKDFYLYCDGNETINFLIKKTASELGSGSMQYGIGNNTCEDYCIKNNRINGNEIDLSNCIDNCYNGIN